MNEKFFAGQSIKHIHQEKYGFVLPEDSDKPNMYYIFWGDSTREWVSGDELEAQFRSIDE